MEPAQTQSISVPTFHTKCRNSDRRVAKNVEIDSPWVEVEVEALEVATTVAVAEEEENNLLQAGITIPIPKIEPNYQITCAMSDQRNKQPILQL